MNAANLGHLDEPRELLPAEHDLIERLLELPFSGRDEIRTQLQTAKVIAEGERDSRSIRFRTDDNAPLAVTRFRVPVEGEALDDDGVAVAVLLHIVEGRAEELEIYRVDRQPIRGTRLADQLNVTVNEEAPDR